MFEAGTVVGRTDAELLDRFRTAGGPDAELAFAALVEWHGPMVWRVCRDVLRESNDADDAFQATFLILARRAGMIRKRTSLGPWLYGVALRISRSARSRMVRRRRRDRVAVKRDRDEPMADIDRMEAAPILHEEVGRLPEKYRTPIVLCYFEGMTHDQAASQLGWPVGTVRSRLAKARDRLRPRLLRRGVEPSFALLLATRPAEAVPAALVSATVGITGAAGIVPAAVSALVTGVLREMTIMKGSILTIRLIVAALVTMAGAGYVMARSQKGETPNQNTQAPKGGPAASGIKIGAVESKTVVVTQQYVCRIGARRNIEVRAPAEGQITAVMVKEGQSVKKDDVLLQVSSAIQKSKLDADLADRNLAQLELDHTKKLFEQKGVSSVEVKLYEVKLAKAQAKVDLSSAELEFTNARAPFDGMVGRLARQDGSFVLKGEALMSLFDNSSMSVAFEMPERRYLEYLAEVARKEQDPTLELVLAGNSKYPHTGKLDTVGAAFNQETASITFHAVFPNPDGLLRNGQTGTIVIGRELKDAIVIPQRATFEEHSKRYVYVVGKDDVAHQREIQVQHELDDNFVLKNGVEAGDRIVVDGIKSARDGGKVE